jgi:hypothetical protein
VTEFDLLAVHGQCVCLWAAFLLFGLTLKGGLSKRLGLVCGKFGGHVLRSFAF